jgi:hypothetical protein
MRNIPEHECVGASSSTLLAAQPPFFLLPRAAGDAGNSNKWVKIVIAGRQAWLPELTDRRPGPRKNAESRMKTRAVSFLNQTLQIWAMSRKPNV